jgi:uncharacterized membrane protein YhhN
MIGLVFGFIGDILLLINGFAQKDSSPTIYFALGALSFLIGHIFYVLSFLESATDSANNDFSLSRIMSLKLVPVYGTILLMLVMASLFYYFTSSHIDNLLFQATVFAAIGSLLFLANDTLLAFYTFHPDWKTKIVSFLLMLTYYISQFLIGKSGIKTAGFFNQTNKSTV